MEYEILPSVKSNMVIMKDIKEHMVGLVAHRVRRDEEQVNNDYDQSSWAKILNERRWTKCESVQEYVFVNDSSYRVAKIDNRLVQIRTGDYYRFRSQILQDVLIKYAGDEDELWELGCGWGFNLFSLSIANRWKLLVGLDISQNAIQAAQQAADYFGLDNMTFGTINLLNLDDHAFDKLRCKTVFTYHCLEQLKYSTEMVLENIRRSGVRRVIHFEPTTELLRLWSLKDLNNYIYIARKDYQNNLLKSLWKMRDKGLIRVIEQKRMYFAPTPRHDNTLVVWEPLS